MPKKSMMDRRIRLFPIIVMAFTMIAVTVVCRNQLNKDISYLEDLAKKVRLEQIQLENEKSRLQMEIAAQDSDEYIINTARDMYGYLMPGEIRFQVKNINDPYAEPEASVVEVGK